MRLRKYDEAILSLSKSEKLFENISNLYASDANNTSPDTNLHFLQHFPGYIVCLNSLAQCFHLNKEFERSNDMYLRVLNIRAFVYSKYHPDYSCTVNCLGLLKLDMNEI